MQVSAAACIATGTPRCSTSVSPFSLPAAGLNVTCINNTMLTQRFYPEDPRREGGFPLELRRMNIGFFVGFAVAGHFQATES